MSKYHCEMCQYKGKDKSNYERHMKTKKHIEKMTLENNITSDSTSDNNVVESDSDSESDSEGLIIDKARVSEIESTLRHQDYELDYLRKRDRRQREDIRELNKKMRIFEEESKKVIYNHCPVIHLELLNVNMEEGEYDRLKGDEFLERLSKCSGCMRAIMKEVPKCTENTK